jgi:hypothetical protein
MAKSGTFQSKQNVNVIIADEATVGTAAAVDATRIVMPVTDFTFSDAFKHSLSVAPSRVGKGGMTQSDDMVKWQRHDVMWDISITFHATAQSVDRVCKALFGDGDGANVLLGSMPSVTAYSHGTSNTTPVTLFFENSSHDGDTVDMHFTSCIATSLSMSGDISMALDLDTTVFQIVGDKVFVDEAGISFDDDGWKQTIPLRFTYDSAATTNDVITINTVA